jgi:hypothetical protein
MPVPLEQRLIVNQWLFGLFGVHSTDGWVRTNGRTEPLLNSFRTMYQIGRDTKDTLDNEGRSEYLMAILDRFVPELTALTEDELLTYDRNIARHTRTINEARLRQGRDEWRWKYFQYLALLFTEIYLDRYFTDPEKLAAELNLQIDRFNDGRPDGERVARFPDGDEGKYGLNMLAFWCATGSGKTHLMHLNILQYQHYLKETGKDRDCRGIILLTPNERLSEQHLQELAEAGIPAALLGSQRPMLFSGKTVEIIDIHKLAETKGDKTVPVEAFLDNNLVLVDEGHVGLKSGEEGVFLRRRNALCERGFSFEYSATFKQALANRPALSERYGRSIIFDYSYKYFYGDGYGKDYRILNLDEADQTQQLNAYLTGCLLTAYQQLRLYDDRTDEMRRFNIERPLWVFVGTSVNAVRTEQGRQVSDVTNILLFLSRFLGQRPQFEQLIDQVIHHGLVTAAGTDIFSNKFTYLAEIRLTPAEIYEDILRRLFRSETGGALHVELLKGGEGELSLKVGNNDEFGVINVGDAKKLYDLCDQTDGLIATEREFAGSIFRTLNERDNPINLLIGSRRFSEGWNSWRVSNLGLMKIGATEGAQIIQLFGRGVRNKGYQYCLRRSREATLPTGVDRPNHIDILETLNVFGIEAGYIAKFRDFLKEEGVPTGEPEIIKLPVVKNLGAADRLKVIRVKSVINGVEVKPMTAFKRLGPIPQLRLPEPNDAWLVQNKTQLNLYPKVRSIDAAGNDGAPLILNQAKLEPKHVAFIDQEAIWKDLVQFKNERGWYNFNIPASAISTLLSDRTWYELLIPPEQMSLNSFESVRVWQEVAAKLLRKYTERYYLYSRRIWEERHLEYVEISADDPNFPTVEDESNYFIEVEPSEQQFISQLQTFADAFANGQVALPFSRNSQNASISIFEFADHLYSPLIQAGGASIRVRPVVLNEDEKRFVEDLKSFVLSAPAILADRQLFLLRNQSRGRGVGFFEAGNFHPDFILWLLDADKQHIAFIDPKGLRNIGPKDPKVEFYKTIKEIEQRLGDQNVHLHSFIVSNTSFHAMLWNMTREEMHARNIVFQTDDRDDYVRMILERVIM